MSRQARGSMQRELGIVVSESEKQTINIGVNGGGLGELYIAIAGFKIETLPVVNQDDVQDRAAKKRSNVFSHEANIKQWGKLINALHSLAISESDVHKSFAVQFTANPRPHFGADISIHVFVRAAAGTRENAKHKAYTVATNFQKIFPKGDLKLSVFSPIPLNEGELREALFHDKDEIQLVTISKFVEQLDTRLGPRVSIPHPFFLAGESPLLGLIEELEQSSENLSVRCEIEPAWLTDDEDKFVGLLHHTFERTVLESERQYGRVGDLANREQQNRISNRTSAKHWAEILNDGEIVNAASISPNEIKCTKRGHYVFKRIYEEQSNLFTITVSLGCAGSKPVPDSTIASVLSAIFSTDAQDAKLGWKAPKITKPEKDQYFKTLQTYKWMLPHCCQSNPKDLRWNSLVTAPEALALFHLPSLNGPTTGIETTSVPFYVTAELLKKMELIRNVKAQITLGYLYHSNICHNPDTVGSENALPFRHPVKALNRPTLISGAPRGGKTNWLFCLLINLWKDCGIPWCVIDPSGGQEYRYLFLEETLKDNLVVYTVGDNITSPLKFNPFALPPSGHGGSNTVRSHTTRLLSCFKAASDMWTPLPEIFQEALSLAYKNFGWSMDDTYETGMRKGLRFPSFSDFAQSLDQHLNEIVIPNYGTGTEAAGILLGGTRDRVNNIVNQLGHILDTKADSSEFFQNLLKTPCVLELGSLGSEDTIALVMSFLLVQIAGHTEYAYRAGFRENKQHLLCVEEAHILLSDESSNRSSATQQGNPRGKAAEDFGRMLLEFSKFGCGIVLVDQRIASLIGSAVDSAYLNLMFRTVAPTSFDHLKTVLNLDARQVEYAHTQLDEGRGILLDRNSGRPVLIRQRNILDELKVRPLIFEEFVERTKLNQQRAGLNVRQYSNEHLNDEPGFTDPSPLIATKQSSGNHNCMVKNRVQPRSLVRE